jgi:hypothetical protein
LHFYTVNQAEPTLRLWKNLSLPGRSYDAGGPAHEGHADVASLDPALTV